MALFITFEGGEGSGKSTQARRLYRRLHQLAIPALLTHEPGVTAIGKRITRWLKWHHDVAISPLTELLLFNVSRAQLVSEVIGPALQDGQIVVCDRFADSSVAYQGYGRGIDIDVVKKTNDIATSELKPDITFLLDMPVEGARMKDTRDRFEMEDAEFHQRVRRGFLTMAEAEPEHWCVIDGTLEKEEIAGIIWEKVRPLLDRQITKNE
jgi:dTMP kinase